MTTINAEQVTASHGRDQKKKSLHVLHCAQKQKAVPVQCKAWSCCESFCWWKRWPKSYSVLCTVSLALIWFLSATTLNTWLGKASSGFLNLIMHPSNKVLARTLATISYGVMSCSVVHPMHPTHGLQEWIHTYSVRVTLLCQYTVEGKGVPPPINSLERSC